MAINPNPNTNQDILNGFSLTGDNTGGWAFRTDIGPAAQWRLSSSISEPTGSAVDKVKALQAYYFYFNQMGNDWGFDSPESVGGQAPRRVGLIAQELQAVEPSLVRPMTWLGEDAAGEGQGDYYWVDYDALYVLCLDAINELNARAEAAKVVLGMTPPETYPTRAASTTIAPKASNFQLSVTPTTGPEGSQSVWTLTADNAADGLAVPFKLMGTCNHKDITCSDPQVSLFTIEEADFEETYTDAEGNVFPKFGEYSVADYGWGNGMFVFSGGQAQITLNYVLDNEAEGPETIEMILFGPTNDNGDVPAGITATAIVTDA